MHSFSCFRKAKPFLGNIKVAEPRDSNKPRCLYLLNKKWTPISSTERNSNNYKIIIHKKWSVTLVERTFQMNDNFFPLLAIFQFL